MAVVRVFVYHYLYWHLVYECDVVKNHLDVSLVFAF